MYTTATSPWQGGFLSQPHFANQAFLPFQFSPQTQGYSTPVQMNAAAVSPWGQQLPFNDMMFAPVGPVQTGFFPAGGINHGFNPNINWQPANSSPGLAPFPAVQQPAFSTGGLPAGIRQVGGLAQPHVELAETNNDVIVTADLPNVDPNNIYVTVTDDSLTISALTQRGGMQGSLHRTVALPTPVRSEHPDISFTNGTLECRLPKSDLMARKRIRVSPTA